ncbi:MAG: DNA repair protein RadC [Lachnospiraceae bacterium]|nr:DNA repair protein RadC [Lachnospiraceae bacterium]
MNTVKDMPEAERPYEKCEKFGAEILTDAELLAVIMRTGTIGSSSMRLAENILEACPMGSSLAGLASMSINELTEIRGIGRVKAIQIKCLTEFSKRVWKSRNRRKTYRSSSEIASYYMEQMRYLDHEEVYIMFLDNKCAFLGDFKLSSGTVDRSLVSVRDIMMNALKRGAVKIVMIHNHPSGDPSPSEDDLKITEKIFKAGKLVDISLVDSIIIGDGIYISLLDETDFYNLLGKHSVMNG